MFKLLPHKFKKIGLKIAPLGFIIWFAMQRRWFSQLLDMVGVENTRVINIVIAVIGFFGFLIGTYFLAFSRERVEDEMIAKVRFESFQFAGAVQLIFLILGFIWIAFTENTIRKDTIMMFFVSVILIFWLVYLLRFNYKVHIEIYKYEK